MPDRLNVAIINRVISALLAVGLQLVKGPLVSIYNLGNGNFLETYEAVGDNIVNRGYKEIFSDGENVRGITRLPNTNGKYPVPLDGNS